jgi:hypothetical protein
MVYLPPLYDLPWDPVTRDVRFELAIVWCPADYAAFMVSRRFQFPPELYPFPECHEMTWGCMSQGTILTAWTILDRLLGWQPGMWCQYEGRLHSAHPLIPVLGAKFAADWLVQIPMWGGTLAGHDLLRWVLREQEKWESQGIDLAAEAYT